MKRLIAAVLTSFSLISLISPAYADSVVCNRAGKICADKSTRERMGSDDFNARSMIIEGYATVGVRDLYEYEWIVLCKSNQFAADRVKHTSYEDGKVAEVTPWESAKDEYHTFDEETQWLKKAACGN